MARNYASILRTLAGFSTTSTTTMTSQGALAVNAIVSADAFGQDTLADATLNIAIIDRGLATFAFGTTRVTAVAQSPDPDSAYAITSTALEIVGADFVRTDHLAGSSWDQHAMADVQQVTFQAIDTHFFSAIAMPAGKSAEITPPGGEIDGNLATFSADIKAEGDETFVELLTDAVSVADTFSSTVLSGSAAAETYVTYQMATGGKRMDLIITDHRMTLVKAGGGTDVVSTGSGDDWIFGNNGGDILSSGAGNDTVFGGKGIDLISGGAGSDWLFGGEGSDVMDGGRNNDLMLGDAGNDILDGGDGDDLIVGGKDRDTLVGGAGNDFFRLGGSGGDGNDTHRGGKRADTYAVVDQFGSDVIFDFSVKEGDRLLLPSLFEEAREDGLRPFNMQRTGSNDLSIDFLYLDGKNGLVLEGFFKTNTEFASLPKKGSFNAEQVDLVLDAIADRATDDAAALAILDLLALTDQVTLIA